ncbi:MAG TPA: peroxidase family protein [Kineosporiaceae bacterium]
MARDGLENRFESYVTTHFEPVWRLLQVIPPVRRLLNKALIDRAVGRMPPRPEPLSTMAPYTSWRSLTDRTYAGRHLPPVGHQEEGRPDVPTAASLFLRTGPTLECPKSTVLFAHFAQWFTDGFLRGDRTHPSEPRRTSSPHEVDLSTLYGADPGVTDLLRSHDGGRLKSQTVNGEEFPPYLCENGEIKPEFHGLQVVDFDRLTVEQRNGLFAMGGDRANSQFGFAMLNVLFLREHNRVAGILERENRGWDDDRVFETARNILIVILIKIVIEEYIHHIAPYYFTFRVDPSASRHAVWYRQNWMTIEFNLLYRWHGLVPSEFHVDGRAVPLREALFNNRLLTGRGLGPLIQDASVQPAGRIGLFNTDKALLETETESIDVGRRVQLASYNDYRRLCHFPRVTDFDQISGDHRVQRALSDHYRDVDRIDYYVGLFAEDQRPNSPLPPLMGRMVGVDAFSQVLTNPLLATRVYNEATFSDAGLRIISATRSLSDLVHRNVPAGSGPYFVSLTRRDWRRQ